MARSPVHHRDSGRRHSGRADQWHADPAGEVWPPPAAQPALSRPAPAGPAYQPGRAPERFSGEPGSRARHSAGITGPESPGPSAPDWPTGGWTTAEWLVDPRLGGPGREEEWLAGEWPTGEWRYDRRPSAAPASAPAMPRLLAAARADGQPVWLSEHLSVHGRVPHPRSDAVGAAAAKLITDSGLRGRGGAGFPVAAKMRAVLAADGPPLLVANGAARDLLAEKDTFLLTRLPHLVLDGAQVAGAAIRAHHIVVAVADRPDVRSIMQEALVERQRARLDPIPVRVEIVAAGYVAGESSALAQQLSGGPARPTSDPPHTAAHGVNGRPTLVQNVETLAHVGLLARHGVGWFRAAGTPDDPGSLLVTVLGAVPGPVVLEVPVGAPVQRALLGAGGLTEPIGAVLVGGGAGRWLPARTGLAAPLSHAGLAAVGGVLGVGAVVALPDRACGVVETARLVRYLAGQSSGQCGACLNGLPAIAAALSALADGKAEPATMARLLRWCGMVTGRGACRHPDGTAGLVASAVRVFAEDVRRHVDGWCGRSLRGVLPVPDVPAPGRVRVGQRP